MERYEQTNIVCNWQYPEGGIKCKNFKLCGHVLPRDWLEYTSDYVCVSCDIFGWKELNFKESDECVICNEIGDIVDFPANCGHSFCVTCSKHILFWDETRYHLSPVPFGCPPCPCLNPIKGKQCYCEDYDEILERWEREHPRQYKEYNDAENLSIELSETTPGSVFGSRTCPLCRKKI